LSMSKTSNYVLENDFECIARLLARS